MFTRAKGVRDFHSSSRGWSVYVNIWQLIQHTLFIYLAPERWHCILFVTGGARWSPPDSCVCVRGFMHPGRHISEEFPCGRSRGAWQISSPGRIGVNEHFNHLAECQSLLGFITSAFPRDKYGKARLRRESTPAGLECFQMGIWCIFWLSDNQILAFAWLAAILSQIFDNVNIAMFGYFHCQLLRKCHKLKI